RRSAPPCCAALAEARLSTQTSRIRFIDATLLLWHCTTQPHDTTTPGHTKRPGIMVLYATLAHTRGYAKFTPHDCRGPPAATPVASLHPAADTPAALFLLRTAIHRTPHSKAAHPILPTEGQPTRAANRQPQ